MKETQCNSNQTKAEGETFISLRNDYAFTQTMKNPMVLRGFLAAVFNMEAEDIQEIEVKDRYLKKTSINGKLGILDVRAFIVGIGDINTEIQIQPYKYWNERTIFYSSQMYVENVMKGEGYEQCRKVISIGILGFNNCKDTSYFYSSYHLKEDERNTLLSDILEFHIIELDKLKCEVKDKHRNLHKWARLINAESEEQRMEIEKDPYIEEALKELEKLSIDPERVAEYMQRDKELRDHVSFMASAKEEGFEEGFGEGFGEGIDKGIDKGTARMSQLIKALVQNNETEKIIEMADNEHLRNELYKKYCIE